MKIKRYFAKDSREAIRQVREELGEDAVILSNRPAEGGVEIVAAVDYDEQLVDKAVTSSQSQPEPTKRPEVKPRSTSARTAMREYGDLEIEEPQAIEPEAPPATARPKIVWSQDPAMQEMRQEINTLRGLLVNQLSGLAWRGMTDDNPGQIEMLRRLMAMGLSPNLCHDLAESVPAQEDEGVMWRHALSRLATRIPIMDDPIVNRGGVVALLGPTGVGKTTTIAKLAARFVLRHGRRQLAIVTTDTYRVGAHEQLNNYGRILDVPVRVARDRDELDAHLRAFADRRLVLVDTAGLSQRDQRLEQQFAMLQGTTRKIDKYLVLSATSQQNGLDEVVNSYQALSPKGCILTKVDEAASIGGGLSVAIGNGLPIGYVCDGQDVPDDLHLARRNNLVNRATNLMKVGQYDISDDFMALTLGGQAVNAHF